MFGDIVRYAGDGGDPTASQASLILQHHLPRAGRVVDVRRLDGGSINRVTLWKTDGEPATVVAKLHDGPEAAAFRREEAALAYFARHTRLPVPTPLAVIEGSPAWSGSGLLLEHIDAPPMPLARLSGRGRAHLDRVLADHLIELHSHVSEGFGRLGDPVAERRDDWLEVFAPMIEGEAAAVRDRLPTRARRAVDRVLTKLSGTIPGPKPPVPTLVHGDLWANNLLVDDAHPDRPTLRGFIDPAAAFVDPEYELAYLRVFDTVGPSFFSRYTQTHPLRPGFDARCRVYWLHTMLLHVRIHGDDYIERTARLAIEAGGEG